MALLRSSAVPVAAGSPKVSTSAREESGIANPSDNDRQTVEPQYWDSPFG